MTAPPRDSGSTTRNAMCDVTVHGLSLQAGHVDGGVHLHQVPHDPPTPWQVRPVPSAFTDRTEDVEAITTWVREREPYVRVVLLHGLPGVGKSLLAARVLDELRKDFPGGQLHVDLHGYAPGGPARLTEVLGQLLRSLYPGALPASVDELSAWWRSVTAEPAKGPKAILLDNATQADQIRRLLPGGRGHLVIVTSRELLAELAGEGALLHPVAPFSPAVATEFLTSVAGPQRITADPHATHAIAHLSAGLPLALSLVGAELAAHPSRSVTEIAAAPTGNRHQILTTPHHLTSFGVALTSSLNHAYWALPRPTGRVYRHLGQLFTHDVDAALAAAVCNLTPDQARQELQALAEAGLLETVREDPARGVVYKLHDEARTHARARALAEATDGELDEWDRRGLDYFLATTTAAEYLLTPTHRRLARDYRYPPSQAAPFSGPNASAAWLLAQRDNLMAAVRTSSAAALHSTCWQMVHAMWPYFRLVHDHRAWFEAHELGLAAAQACGDALAQRELLNTWGVGLRGDAQYAVAIERFEQVLQLARAAGDQQGEAQALHEIGATHLAADRLDAAWEPLGQGRSLRRTLAAEATDPALRRTYTRSVALSDIALGQVAIGLDDATGAIELLTSARKTLRDEVEDPFDAGRALAWLGRAHARAGDFTTAEREGRQAIEEFTTARSPRWTARSLELLGQTQQEAGNLESARTSYEQSLEAYRSISQRDADRVRRQLQAAS